ncbi:hypothetical protein MOJ79_03655 [Calidifontimicrobium sp. SYSU G02091]|nr:hypothetical protein [Calidifontimicrobium sp. SYSU G02091]MCI1190930.1 hypothetical protein [Calidifontimicrobium sp. SYSU G02091]
MARFEDDGAFALQALQQRRPLRRREVGVEAPDLAPDELLGAQPEAAAGLFVAARDAALAIDPERRVGAVVDRELRQLELALDAPALRSLALGLDGVQRTQRSPRRAGVEPDHAELGVPRGAVCPPLAPAEGTGRSERTLGERGRTRGVRGRELVERPPLQCVGRDAVVRRGDGVRSDEAARVEVHLDDGQRRRREVGERQAAGRLGSGQRRLQGTVALVAAAPAVAIGRHARDDAPGGIIASPPAPPPRGQRAGGAAAFAPSPAAVPRQPTRQTLSMLVPPG